MRSNTFRCARRALAALITGVAAAACGDDLGSGPQVQFDGVRYTARTEEVLGTTPGSTARQITVFVTLNNRTSTTQTRTYPAACPVRIRLYRINDDALVYAEDRRSCTATPTATITIDPQSSATLQSGVRFPAIMLGDSLPPAIYTVRAVVKTEGEKFVLIDAGTANLSN